jgi:rubredoxin
MNAIATDSKEVTMKYQCTICGYVYDPAAGDPEHGIEPGTAWEAIPESWTCPHCGVDKSMFEAVD